MSDCAEVEHMCLLVRLLEVQESSHLRDLTVGRVPKKGDRHITKACEVRNKPLQLPAPLLTRLPLVSYVSVICPRH